MARNLYHVPLTARALPFFGFALLGPPAPLPQPARGPGCWFHSGPTLASPARRPAAQVVGYILGFVLATPPPPPARRPAGAFPPWLGLGALSGAGVFLGPSGFAGVRPGPGPGSLAPSPSPRTLHNSYLWGSQACEPGPINVSGRASPCLIEH